MNRTPVSSTHIESIGHEGDELEVEFKNGSVYRYQGVPRSIFDDFMKVDSVGRHFNTHVKGKYQHRQMPSEPS